MRTSGVFYMEVHCYFKTEYRATAFSLLWKLIHVTRISFFCYHLFNPFNEACYSQYAKIKLQVSNDQLYFKQTRCRITKPLPVNRIKNILVQSQGVCRRHINFCSDIEICALWDRTSLEKGKKMLVFIIFFPTIFSKSYFLMGNKIRHYVEKSFIVTKRQKNRKLKRVANENK